LHILACKKYWLMATSSPASTSLSASMTSFVPFMRKSSCSVVERHGGCQRALLDRKRAVWRGDRRPSTAPPSKAEVP